MIRTVDIEVSGRPDWEGDEAWVLAPRPFDHWGQRLHGFEAEGVSAIREIVATNSGCRAYLMRATGDVVRLRYELALCDEPAPDWVWRVERNRHTIAAPSLIDAAQKLGEGATTERLALRRLIDDAAAIFGYGHVDERFNDGCDTVPLVCGTAKGSCVDINTYLLAAALSLGIRGQYIAGYWFHPDKTETTDMHCWLAFEPDGELVFWDLAHALKWSATLGAQVSEGLNPAGGRRVAMSCGRGLRFETPHGPVEISHFSEPVWIGPKANAERCAKRGSALRISVEDPDGRRDQFPIVEAAE